MTQIDHVDDAVQVDANVLAGTDLRAQVREDQ